MSAITSSIRVQIVPFTHLFRTALRTFGLVKLTVRRGPNGPNDRAVVVSGGFFKNLTFTPLCGEIIRIIEMLTWLNWLAMETHCICSGHCDESKGTQENLCADSRVVLGRVEQAFELYVYIRIIEMLTWLDWLAMKTHCIGLVSVKSGHCNESNLCADWAASSRLSTRGLRTIRLQCNRWPTLQISSVCAQQLQRCLPNSIV